VKSAGGNRFIGVSWAGNGGVPESERAKARLERLLSGWRRLAHADSLLACEPSGFCSLDRGAPLCMSMPGVVDPVKGLMLDPSALSQRLVETGSGLARELAAPFSGVWMEPASGRLQSSTDAFGIGQLFYVQCEAGAAVSNSAVLLARAFDRDLDAETLTGFGVFGAFIGGETAFDGVIKVPPGCSVELESGRLRLQPGPERRSTDGEASIDQMADRLREIVTKMSDAAPEADLQLSGGLDSRLILAALPPDRRRRHRAVTIGGAGSPDVAIASAIAERLGMRSRVVDTDTVDDLDREAFAALLRQAVESFDGAANPVDKATLLLAEPRLDGDAWFNGQNGESLRGFYYPGQRLDARPSESLARALIGWRLATNDVANPRLFDPEAYRERKARAEARMVERLIGMADVWSLALDRFYVEERMQRWAGNGIDHRLNRRAYLCPFFDPGFVRDALALPAASKAGAQAAFRLLHRLDPDLASIPLDSGLRPAAVIDTPLQARLARMGYFIKKAGRRVKRRLAKGGGATLGSASIVQLWHRHRLYEQLPTDRLLATGLFAPEMLGQIASGKWLPDRPTLGFVLMTAELSRSV